MDLTPKQKKIMAIAKSFGKVTAKDCRQIYTAYVSIDNSLKRLVELNLLKRTESGKFVYNVERDGEVITMLQR